ncbi:50S ribosomal protein L31 [Halarsenatibacter silvermanii]|uniref:Large ribosomal subunit protein bL31 n=1 Tax=Halarsenatibacter silvermanii TaxID=321763 RepID=A0A1G9HXC2_9FIRM|nr:50S ribosomal protein L31 [Halarsenatibacter silvermanii]SDL17502.1 large subunit ribosomal protein L31 [Halarsenatibacter silvermanii]
MKEEIHPETTDTVITCACGEEYQTESTGDDMRVEVCSNCHPFYTGKQRQTARGSRVEQFNRKYGRDSSEEESGETDQNEMEASEEAEE